MAKVTVTGNIQAITGVAATSGYVEFILSPQSSSILYRVPAIGLLVPAVARLGIDSSGNIKSLSLLAAGEVWGNDQISPVNTTYTIRFAPNNVVVATIHNVLITGAGPYDLTQPVISPNVELVPDYITVTADPLEANLIPVAAHRFSVGASGREWAEGHFDAIFTSSINATPLVSTLPFIVAEDYNFSAQAPGGTLTASVPATVLLSPVPAGIYGSAVGHYLYISGGTGGAEAVLITGGTAVGGAGSGTVTFTPANNHSGLWTIRSASGGIQEAGNYLLATGAGGTVYVLTSVSMRAPVMFKGVATGATSGPSRLLLKLDPNVVLTFPSGMVGDGITFTAEIQSACPGTPTVHMLYSGIEGGKIWAGSTTNTITGNLIVLQAVDFAVVRDVELRGGATSAIKVIRCYGGEISDNFFVHNGSSVWNTNGLVCDSANAMRLFNNQHYDNLNPTLGAIYSDTWGEDWVIDGDYFEGITGRVIYQKINAGAVGTSWKLLNSFVNANVATQGLVQFDGNRTTVMGNTFRGTTGANPILWIANVQGKVQGNEFSGNSQTAPDILLADTGNLVIGNTFAQKDTTAGSLCIGAGFRDQIITGNIFWQITGSGRIMTINADNIAVTWNLADSTTTVTNGIVITPGTTSYAAFNSGFPTGSPNLLSGNDSILSLVGAINVTGRLGTSYGTNTASANNLTLPSDGNTITITGNTQINAITLLNWPNSTEITLLFTGSPLLKHNTAGGAGTGPLHLSGGIDFTPSNPTVMKFFLAGSDWYESSRSVNHA